jgi:hypothetical protein
VPFLPFYELILSVACGDHRLTVSSFCRACNSRSPRHTFSGWSFRSGCAVSSRYESLCCAPAKPPSINIRPFGGGLFIFRDTGV